MIIPVAAAFICKNDRFLICRRPANKANGGLWEFPGGKLEAGETAAQAIVRECREELAIDLFSEEDPIAVVNRENGNNTIQLMLMKCRIISGTLSLLEHSDACWIVPDDYASYDFCPADMQLLKILFPNVCRA